MLTKHSAIESLFRDNKLVLSGTTVYHAVDSSVFSRLFNFFEASFRSIAKSYAATDLYAGPILNKQILEQAEYFTSFPTLAVQLHDGWFLNPAVCFHTYNHFSGKKVDVICTTSQSACFRNEHRYEPLKRLMGFTMREIVFLGNVEKVETFRKSILYDIYTFASQLKLGGSIVKAQDPFFISPHNKGKILLQKLQPLKFELTLNIKPDESIAVASFNNHHDFFCKRFNISLKQNGPAYSSCVAFGIERWVYAFMRQHGVNTQNWPDQVQTYGEVS